MIRIVCISDTHGRHPRLKLPDGDILIHAGDFTEHGEAYEVDPFLDWLEALPHRHKVFIAGNHDFYLERHPEYFAKQVRAIPRVYYLNDSGVTIEGFRFWGSPVQPRFYDWAFNRHRGAEIQEHWDRIPKHTQVLITHGPPMGIGDHNGSVNTGCADLKRTIGELPQIKLHVFGHIHEGYGRYEVGSHTAINASVLDVRYALVNQPIVVELQSQL